MRLPSAIGPPSNLKASWAASRNRLFATLTAVARALVRPRRGGICHTKNSRGQARDCYYRKLNFDTWELENLNP